MLYIENEMKKLNNKQKGKKGGMMGTIIKLFVGTDKITQTGAGEFKVEKELDELMVFLIGSTTVVFLKEHCTALTHENVIAVRDMSGNLSNIIEEGIKLGAKEIRIGSLVIRLPEKEEK